MIWFGSSAGVALSNMYPEAKSVGRWVSQGWPVALAYVVGFFVMLARARLAPGHAALAPRRWSSHHPSTGVWSDFRPQCYPSFILVVARK